MHLSVVLVGLHDGPQGGGEEQDLADQVGTSKRTIYRDIRALDEELGVPVFQAGRGRYGIEKKYFLPPLRLTLPEAVVLFLSSRLIAPPASTACVDSG